MNYHRTGAAALGPCDTCMGRTAQQLRARVAGADEVDVEVHLSDVQAVAAPRPGRFGLHNREVNARGGRRSAARCLGLDPHPARRAVVAAGGLNKVFCTHTRARVRARAVTRTHTCAGLCRRPKRSALRHRRECERARECCTLHAAYAAVTPWAV